MAKVLDSLELIREYGSFATEFPWYPSGKLFYANYKPLIVKRFTAFKLLNLFEQGRNVSNWLNQFNGYNSLRIFTYTEWGLDSWDFPSREATLDFLDFTKDRGFNVSICLLTDKNPSRIEQAEDLVMYLDDHSPTNLCLEAVNEPGIHDKSDPSVLQSILSRVSHKFPISSGWYTDTRKHYGNHWLDHSPRESDWFAEGGHRLMEGYVGGGPTFPDEPKLNQPCLEDEPIRPDQAGFDHIGFYEYAASCVLLGAGATFHSNFGKFCIDPSPDEARCKEWFLRGLNAFPPIDYINYRRIVEDDQPAYARTYINGNYSIRIKQNGLKHPESGWVALDEFGICWRR